MPKKSETKNKKTVKKPKAEKPKKQKLTEKELEKQILDLQKQGLTSEKIGEKLRQQGIHSKEHNAKISNILKKHNAYINPDIKNVSEKLEKLRAHYEKNKQDKRAKREVDRIAQQLRKLKKHFKEQ